MNRAETYRSGCIFAKKSKRACTREEAQAVVAAVRAFGERDRRVYARPPAGSEGWANLEAAAAQLRALTRPLVFGVFVDEELDALVEEAEQCGLDGVQLHGRESEEYIRAARARLPDVVVAKVVHVPPDATAPDIVDATTGLAGLVDVVLLDAALAAGAVSGGAGVTFNQEIARAVVGRGPVFLAGGFGPHNVADAVGSLHPFGIDASSALEVSPGVKDAEKVKAYVQAALSA